MLVWFSCSLFGFSGFFGLDSRSSRKILWTGSGGRISRFVLSALHYLCTLYSAFLAWGGHSNTASPARLVCCNTHFCEQRGSVLQQCMQQSPIFQIIVLNYVDDVVIAVPTVDERII